MGLNNPRGLFTDLRHFFDPPKSENGRRPKGPATATPVPTEKDRSPEEDPGTRSVTSANLEPARTAAAPAADGLVDQTELAEMAGTVQATVILPERGAQPRTVRKLAEALGVEPSELRVW
jgi:hypothetical protein